MLRTWKTNRSRYYNFAILIRSRPPNPPPVPSAEPTIELDDDDLNV